MGNLSGASADRHDSGLWMSTVNRARPDPERLRHAAMIVASVSDERIVGGMLGTDCGQCGGRQIFERLRRLIFPTDIGEQRAFGADHIEQCTDYRFCAA